MPAPVAHRHYPANLAEFVAWFSTDEDCRDYLRWLRWPDGFRCPECDEPGWELGNGRHECVACHLRTSLTAGTIFDGPRLPLTLWFHAAWLFSTNKDGVSASALKRQLDLHSYQTAWTMLTKFRVATAHQDRTRLSGEVEVDETLFGGLTQGLRGRAPGAKVLIGIAVERVPGAGFGRCRMGVLPSANAGNLRAFIDANIEPGSTIYTDGWAGYGTALRNAPYQHVPTVAPGAQVARVLPGVHRIASLFKRWVLGTHQGSVGWDHVALYLDEFVFRFNRRRSRHRGLVFLRLMELAVEHSAVRYKDLTPNVGRSKGQPRTPPPTVGRGLTASVERPRADRPWRAP